MRANNNFPKFGLCFVVSVVLERGRCFSLGFLQARHGSARDGVALNAEGGRREFIASLAAAPLVLSGVTKQAWAEDNDDLTAQLFNPDGSLKEGIESAAKFRTVEFSWDSSLSDGYRINFDGIDATGSSNSGTNTMVKLSYDLPLKWKGPEKDELYTDLTVKEQEGAKPVKALTSITIYQSPEPVKQERLEKATTIGVAKALNVIPALSALESADLVGGRVRTVGGNKQKMFDFDMAVAPKTCADSKDNLGLGFCPFDTVYLLTGTVVNDRLYVFCLQCNKDQWKRSNSDLRKVRSTFSVTA